MSNSDPVTVFRRFGLGARPGDLQRVASDPRGYLLAAIADRNAALLQPSSLRSSQVVFAETEQAQMEQRLARAIAADKSKAAVADAVPPMSAENPAAPQAKTPPLLPETPARLRGEALKEETAARIERAITTDNALAERLVLFWSNHFCVSVAKGPVRGLAGAYEREAIRPHVLGRFADMLRAVEQHPAMLIYLDNQVSTGPNSRAGRKGARGLNENLAREILELHTLGVDGGYTQQDVTNLARVITGWSVGQANVKDSVSGTFHFAAVRHEPGNWKVVGKTYGESGQAAGEQALDDLARHPATARHIAVKLARHFVADAAPEALIETLRKRFVETDGDLAAVTRVLIESDAVWAAPPAKIVPPYDYVISFMRGLGMKRDPAEIARLASLLGQPVWQVPSPKGWPDADDSWMGPSAIRERLRMVERLVRDADPLIDPRLAASDLAGPVLSEATRQAVARAETRQQGLELFAMSPEFIRR